MSQTRSILLRRLSELPSRDPATCRLRTYQCSLDTGADLSFIPMGAASVVRAEIKLGSSVTTMFSGDRATYDEATVRLDFLHIRFRGQFLVSQTDYGIIGRNILNYIRVVLDGPAQEWTA